MNKKPLWIITDGDAYESVNLAVTGDFRIACIYASIHDGEIQPIGELASEWTLTCKLSGKLKDVSSVRSSWIRLTIQSDGKTIANLDFGLDSSLPVGLTLEENRVNAYRFAYDNDIEVTDVE